jgi:hypothetical protein
MLGWGQRAFSKFPWLIAAAVALLATSVGVVGAAMLASSHSAKTTESMLRGRRLDAPVNEQQLLRDANLPKPSRPPYGTPRNADGRAGSDQHAVAYKVTAEGPVMVTVSGKQLPHSRLFYTGWGGWEPTLGANRRGEIFYGSYDTSLDPIVLRSTDGGRTWANVTPPVFKFSLDPYMWLDPGTGRIFDTNLQPSVTCPPIASSDTGGSSWSSSTVCGEFDHETIFGGPAPPGADQPAGYSHAVYYCAINVVATASASSVTTCSKSLDGGKTWIPTGEPPYPPHLVVNSPSGSGFCDGGVGHGVTAPDGTVYLPRAWCGPPYLAISHDEGSSWSREQITTRPSLSIPAGGDHETGVAVDSAGDLYYTWVASNHHPFLSISRDGGTRWSAPLDVMPPGITTMSAFTTEIVGQDPGRIALLFVGTSDPPGTPTASTTWNAYLLESINSLSRDPLFYAVSLNDPRTNPLWRGDCGDIRCGNMGDFLDLVIGPDGRPWGALVDGCPGTGNACVPSCGGLDNSCPKSPSLTTPRGEGAVATVIRGPSLLASGQTRRSASPATSGSRSAPRPRPRSRPDRQ